MNVVQARAADRAEPPSEQPHGSRAGKRDRTRLLGPVYVIELGSARSASGSSANGLTRHALRLVRRPEARGTVRAVVQPGVGVSLAFDAGDRTHCMEANFVFDPTRPVGDVRKLVSLFQKQLDAHLLDSCGRLNPAANVAYAFKCGLLAVNGWLTLGRELSAAEVELAVSTHDPAVHPWACEKPKRS